MNGKAGGTIYRRIFGICMVWMILCMYSLPAFADAQTKDASVIRVGYYESAGFQEYDEATDTYSGYSYEFLKAMEQYGNWSYEFVPCTFRDGLHMLETGEIDIMNNVSWTAERAEIYDFTSLASGENIAYLAMRAGDTRVAYKDYAAMEQIKIGLAKDSIYSSRLVELFQREHVNADITWYASHEELGTAFDTGAVDAYVITSSSISDEHVILSFEPDAYYIATKKGNTELVMDLDQAITALRQNDNDFENKLSEKYYGHKTENYTVLTGAEQKYMESHPEVKVLFFTNWYPLCYSDEKGEFAGALRSVYDLLEERTGLKFHYIADDGSEDIVETSGIQIISEQPTDFSRADQYGLKLTKTFVTIPLMAVSNRVLEANDTIALVDGDYLSEVVVRKYGDYYQYEYLDSVDACMDAVNQGTVDGTVLISYESEYYRQQAKYSKLKYTIVDVSSYGLSIAVLADEDPALYSIIQKGLNSISKGEISNIFNQTLFSLQRDDISSIFYRHPLAVIVSTFLLAVLIVGALLALYFVGKFKRQNEIIHQKNLELQKANDETTNFLSRMSHDMRTPMNGILGVSRLSMDETDSQVLKKNMQKIENSGEYLLNLINDTLDFQKIESGKMELHSEVCDFRDVLKNITEMNKSSVEEKHLELRVINLGTGGSSYVRLDSVRFQQIFMNLLSNAIKFTPPGGTVELKHECTGTDGDISHDIFQVSDTGIGISKEFIEQNMFHPFAQEQTEITSQYAGSGLGLSIVKRLVELMGGTIEVESDLGSGTTFTVHLDITHVDKEVAEKELRKTSDRLEGNLEQLMDKRILLVEDHPLNAEIARKLLEKVGCKVNWVDNGKKAVDTVADSEEHSYDAILMDIRMPVMDGLTATKEIRNLDCQEAKTIPIIAMTANAYDSDVENCRKAGMNAHIAKPIDVKEVYRVLMEQIAGE